MKTFLRFFTVALLLTLLCLALQSSPALAQTTTTSTTSQAQTRPVVVSLNRHLGEYYFTPTDVSIETDTILVIVNQTGRDVTLMNDGNFDGVLLRGNSYLTAFYSGVYRFDDVQGNVRAPLNVTVQDDSAIVPGFR